MKKVIFPFAIAVLGTGLYAQSASNPLTAGSEVFYHIVRNNVLKAAEEMPEQNYSFKPTPEVRSFGQLVGHVADSQYEFCAPVIGDGTESPGVEKNKTSKADLIAGLKTAYAYCDKAYAGMTDAHAADLVTFFGHQAPKLDVLGYNAAHTDEHYGNMVTYMRMKGLVPPSSQHSGNR